MLKSVTLKNFKAHRDTTIQAQRINVFIGPNNSGKSSVFQALLALKQAARPRPGQGHIFLPTPPRTRTKDDPYQFYPPNVLIDLGNFDSLLQDRSADLTLAVAGVLPPHGLARLTESVHLEFEIHVRNNELESHTGKLQVSGRETQWQFARNLTGQGASHIHVGAANLALRLENIFRLLAFESATLPPGASPQDHGVASQLGNYLASAPATFLESLRMIYPLRGLEEWGFPLPSHPAKDLEALTLEERTTATAGLLAYDSDRVDALSQHFESLFGFKVKVRLLPGQRLTLQVRGARKSNDALLSNEGTGATQLPFILVPMMLAETGDSIFLCEPEAHLHPKAQSDLMSLVLRIAEHRSLQLFIETHSEHVLHKLLHTVAKGELAKDDVAIYYFTLQDGVSHAERLEVDETGGVKGGLPGFFDQSLNELEEYLDALKGAKP